MAIIGNFPSATLKTSNVLIFTMSQLPESLFDIEHYYDQKDMYTEKIFELTERLLEAYEKFNDFFTYYACECLPEWIIKRFQYNDDKWQLDYIIKTHPQLLEREKKVEKGLSTFLEGLCNCIDDYLKNADKEMVEYFETGKITHKCFREYLNKARITAHWQNIHDKAKEFAHNKKTKHFEQEIVESL